MKSVNYKDGDPDNNALDNLETHSTVGDAPARIWIDRESTYLNVKEYRLYPANGDTEYIAKSVVDKLVEALKTFGEHDELCEVWTAGSGSRPCTCGLNVVLAEYKETVK